MSISPEMQKIPTELLLAIQTIVRQEHEAAIAQSISDQVKNEINARDEITRDYFKDKLDQRIMSYSENGIKVFLQALIDENIAKLNSRMRALEDKFQMLLNRSMPEYYIKAIDDLNASIVETKSDIKMFGVKLDEVIIGKDDSNPTDDELKRLYKLGGATLDMVANHFKVSTQQAWKYTNGEIKDTQTRIAIKNFLKKKSRLQTSLN